MSDPKISGTTRGEYNRTFDAEAVREKGSGFSFVCPDCQQYLLRLKPGRKDVYNGEVITKEDIVAQFENFYFNTDDPEVAELIRKSDAVKRGRVRELSALKQDLRERKVDATAKALAADPELLRAAVAQLKTGKGNAPEVK
jgi:hypothetical protein